MADSDFHQCPRKPPHVFLAQRAEQCQNLPHYGPADPSYTEIYELIKKCATLEAQEKIMALRESVLALQEENLALRSELQSLKRITEVESVVQFNGLGYQIIGHGKQDGHFCPTCFARVTLIGEGVS